MQSSLLSPAEGHAFQSFLSAMDYPDDTLTASEWAIYNAGGPMYGTHDDMDDSGGSNPAQREALSKATKDLMSLEPDGWNRDGAMMEGGGNLQVFDTRGHFDMQHQQQQQQDHHHFTQRQQAMQHLQQQQHQQQEQQHRQHSVSSGTDLFPFLHSKQQELRYPMHLHLGPSQMTANSDHGSPTSPHSPFNFPPQQLQQHSLRSIAQQQQQQQQQQNHLQHPHQVHIPAHPEQQPRQRQQQQQQQQQQRGLSPASSSTARSTRRTSSSRLTPLAGSSHPNNAGNVASTSANGRSNGATDGNHASTTTVKHQRSSTSPSADADANASGPAGSAAKQTLLSPSQKKANHIQSEQKRRANIRRGYEALCETVPALREAIREEEEAERLASLTGGRGGSTTQRKKNRGKKGAKDGEDKDKDRLDGRAGPRSENVVLSKTIEHIQALIADRSALLARLHRARSSLPPGHPALTPLIPDPPWEREWKGGIGRLGDEDMDGSEAEGDDGDEDGE